MKTLGNFVWFIFCGGLLSALIWFIGGIIMALTIVGLPFAYCAFRIGRFAAFPFGKELIDARLLGEKRVFGTALANFLWCLLAGIWLAMAHVLSAIICIVACGFIAPILFGAPAWAMAHLRLAGVSLTPLGKRVVSTELATEAKRRAIGRQLDRMGV